MSAFDGKWAIVTNTPMGAQNGTLNLSSDGGTLTGTMDGQQGSVDIADGQVDGNEGSWKASLTQPMPITLEFSAKVDGDEISGNVKLGGFGNATFKGSRA